MGFYRNEQGGFCLPGTSEDNIESSSVSTITSSVHVYREGTITGNTEGNTINAMHNMMHDHDMAKMNVFWANASKTRLNEVGLNPRFKFKTPYVDI